MDAEKNTGRTESNRQATPAEDGTLEIKLRAIVPRIKEGYLLRKVGQAYMVMPTGPRMKDYEGMITLNETGAFLFKEAQKPDTEPSKLIQACIDEYNATEEEAKQAVDAFIHQCADCGLFDFEEQVITGLTEEDALKLGFALPPKPEPPEASQESSEPSGPKE